MHPETYLWMETAHPLLLLLIGFASLLIVFIPSFVAVIRNHPNRVAILVLNILFGWTGLGWIILLVWASVAKPAKHPLPL